MAAINLPRLCGSAQAALAVEPAALVEAVRRLEYHGRSRRTDCVCHQPYLTGKKEGSPHEALYWRVIGGAGYAVRQGKWKLIKPAAQDVVHLFDLEADPRERHDLADRHPERVQGMQALYERWDSQMTQPLWTDPHAENVQKEHEAVTSARRRALPPSGRRN